MKGSGAFRILLARCAAVPFTGHGFRVIPGSSVVEKIPFDRLWFGQSAGRCNPRGVSRLYAALERATAVAEFEHYQRAAGLDPVLTESFHYAIEIRLQSVVDLTDRKQRAILGLSMRGLRKAYLDRARPPLTGPQLLGLAIAQGVGSISALVYPSVRMNGGRNIVIFRDRLSRGTDLITALGDPAARLP